MSHNHGNASSANDPRQPWAAKPYTPRPVAPEDLPVDYSGFLAVILGVSGVMFRVNFIKSDLSSSDCCSVKSQYNRRNSYADSVT